MVSRYVKNIKIIIDSDNGADIGGNLNCNEITLYDGP
jgi:hypothetical protein